MESKVRITRYASNVVDTMKTLTKIKHTILCLFGYHVWKRPMFFRLNMLPGEEDFKCHFCGKHKTFYNRKETITVIDTRPAL